MPTRNVLLTEHYDKFIADGVASGRFSDASEAVQAGLELLAAQTGDEDAKLEWLRKVGLEASKAFARGEGIPITSEKDIDLLVDRILAEVRGEPRSHE